ncbi:hypothetical protein BGAL_0002g00410 [Botrytis galanthina]|uniref:Uncharacterized protein n=1 Tax=Botrytis galanthina TaxID=278940 RepID=A0A4V4HW58_9HELO|nr:hypothetical protein BGAL_0002g00410 [Botrytis galanthina]
MTCIKPKPAPPHRTAQHNAYAYAYSAHTERQKIDNGEVASTMYWRLRGLSEASRRLWIFQSETGGTKGRILNLFDR